MEPDRVCDGATSRSRLWLLTDQAIAERLAASGQRRVCDDYLTISALEHWAALIEQLVD